MMKWAQPSGVLAMAMAMCVLLGACAHKPAMQPRELGEGWALERSVIEGLIQVEASDAQRVAVLAVFDRINPQLHNNSKRMAHLQRQWAELDAQDGAYAGLRDGLLQQRTAAFQGRLQLEAEFDQAIAAILKPEQWQQWRALTKFEVQREQRSSGHRGDAQGQRPQRRRVAA